ncbi:iron-siderophore ABC transporter substrate-binding protein [Fluviispira multicolorata]|uniref:ABC transporter substrate-binding protein n=1 Tax=Fluviispira multicolorata TaxID=2654512 RepID=A0A833N2N2_9BACT|nr:iron-siderophore ABC transporter substrate-binding protein [Fluviispira multicolorata]KAB8033158.1 ABC transporter substrate-binding protein [Fluviispira multicolorata]
MKSKMFKFKILLFLAALCTFNLSFASREILKFKEDISKFNFKEPPKRVITLTITGMEILDLLGITPVGITVTASGKIPDYLDNDMSKITLVGKTSHPSLERIKELTPDLIIIDRVYEEQRDVVSKLEKIAPVIRFKPYSYKETLEYIDIFAELFQKQNKAKQFKEKFNKELAKAKKSFQNKSISILAMYKPHDKIWAWTNDSYIASFINEIGADYVYKGEGDKNKLDLVELNAERILKLNPTNILVFDDPGKNVLKVLEKNPIWKNLRAVKNNKVTVLERERGSRSKGPKGALYILENLNELLK